MENVGHVKVTSGVENITRTQSHTQKNANFSNQKGAIMQYQTGIQKDWALCCVSVKLDDVTKISHS